MKRALRQLISIAGLAAVCSVAWAQDSFPDTPANHWAFDSLSRLRKDGILVGYPDGLYRGGRPASRYEIAAAVHAAYVNLKATTDGLDAQLKVLNAKLDSGSGVTGKDLDDLKAALAATKSQLDGMKGWSADLDDLKKLSTTFEKELTSMGVNVEAMKDDLSKLESRVATLEKKKLPINIAGELNLVSLGGYSSNGDFGISVDGRPTGVGRGDYGAGFLDNAARVGVTRDLSILSEAAISLFSDNEAGPNFKGTVVAGNMIGQPSGKNNAGSVAFGDQSRVYPGSPFQEGQTNIYLQDFSINFDSTLGGIPFNTEMGRVGFVINPYIFQRPDNTPYFANDRWDSGMWNFDGAIVTLDYGTTKLKFFGGKNNLNNGGATNGTALQTMAAGAESGPFTVGVNRPRGITPDLLNIQQSLGTSLNVPITRAGTLNLAYLWLSSDTTQAVGANAANNVRVYGGDLKLSANDIGFEGGYSRSDLMGNNKSLVTQDNDAFWLSVNKDWKKYGAKAGYRYIAPQFAAPGDWGRIGIWWNPTDIKGFTGDVHYDLSTALKLTAGGEFYTGTGKPSSTLSPDDKIQRYVIGLDYSVGKRYDVSLGYEEARWDLADRSSISFAGGSPVERWLNIGFGMNLSTAAKLKFMYQMSDYNSDGVTGFSPFLDSASTTAKGGLITTQLSVKF